MTVLKKLVTVCPRVHVSGHRSVELWGVWCRREQRRISVAFAGWALNIRVIQSRKSQGC